MQTYGAQSALGKLKMKFVRLLLTKDARRGVEAFKARKTAKFEGD